MTATTAPLTPGPAASSVPAEVVIQTDKLSKTFSTGGAQQHVLKNLDLQITAGELTVIMGPSGSGKSTLLYAISGMDRPTLGSVRLAGTEISGYSEDELARFRREHCGFVFQQIYLLDSMSVLDNVMAVGLLAGGDRRTVRARAVGLFEQVGLTHADYKKFPSMLSGGEAQRVGLVRSLINQPDVVFADEPTGQLNSEFSRLVLDLISGVNADGQTVVMVTHDVRSAVRASRILYLRDGSIQGELELGPWSGDDAARTETLTDFLAELGW